MCLSDQSIKKKLDNYINNDNISIEIYIWSGIIATVILKSAYYLDWMDLMLFVQAFVSIIFLEAALLIVSCSYKRLMHDKI